MGKGLHVFPFCLLQQILKFGVVFVNQVWSSGLQLFHTFLQLVSFRLSKLASKEEVSQLLAVDHFL